jgi:hypothetical protein
MYHAKVVMLLARQDAKFLANHVLHAKVVMLLARQDAKFLAKAAMLPARAAILAKHVIMIVKVATNVRLAIIVKVCNFVSRGLCY